MNPSLFQLAQSEIAQGLVRDEVLANRTRASKIGALISAGATKYVAPVATAVGMLLGGAAAGPSEAHAQNWSPYATTTSQADVQAQRAAIEMQRRQEQAAQREAQRMADQQARQSAQTTRIMGDLAANVLGQLVFSQGGNYNQANSARDVARTTVQVVNGQAGNTTAERLAIGAMVGTAAGGMTAKDPRGAAARAAIGAVAGAGAGYAWDRTSAAAQPAATVQHGGHPAADGHQVQRAVVHTAPAAPVAAQRQLVVYDAASMGLPQVMVDVARAGNMGVVAPGTRPIPLQNMEQVRQDPLLDNVFRSLKTTVDSLADRGALVMMMDKMRAEGANQIELGQTAQKLAKADDVAKRQIRASMDMINKAASVGGYDTRPVLEMAGNVIGTGYVPDSSVGFRANTEYRVTPR